MAVLGNFKYLILHIRYKLRDLCGSFISLRHVSLDYQGKYHNTNICQHEPLVYCERCQSTLRVIWVLYILSCQCEIPYLTKMECNIWNNDKHCWRQLAGWLAPGSHVINSRCSLTDLNLLRTWPDFALYFLIGLPSQCPYKWTRKQTDKTKGYCSQDVLLFEDQS